MDWPLTYSIGRYTFGLFNYWIGFSIRYPKPFRVVDLGFFKIMITAKRPSHMNWERS